MRVGNTIYLDHQATTPVDPKVMSAMQPYFSEIFGNPHSSEHTLGWAASKAIDVAQSKVASLIGADPDEIIFTSGATEANNLSMLGIARGNKSKRNKVLISAVEHKCIQTIAHSLNKHFGLVVSIIPVDSQGTIDLNWLRDELGDDVLLVSVMAVNNEIGTIQPIEQIGKFTKRSGALFHCDAAQAPCAIDIDVFSMGIDMLSLSAHKFYGPKGIGAAYIRRKLQKVIEPVTSGAGQQNGLRGGTLPTPLCAGMGAAVELLQSDAERRERVQVAALRDRFIKKILELFGPVKVNGPDFRNRHPGNINLSFGNVNAQDLLTAMQPKLAASSGAACSSGVMEASYVLRAIGLTIEEAESSIRFGIGRFTTEDDIDVSVEYICKALEQLRE